MNRRQAQRIESAIAHGDDDMPVGHRRGRRQHLLHGAVQIDAGLGAARFEVAKRRDQEPRLTHEAFRAAIVGRTRLKQSERQPLVCPISLHPFVMGRPYRIRQLRRALQHIAGHRDRVWLTRPRDICTHIEGLPKGVVPSSDDA